MTTDTTTRPDLADQECREAAARIKAKKIDRKSELRRRSDELLAEERNLIAMAPAGNELLAKYMNEVDYLAEQYRREFGAKNQRASNLELTSHKAMCFFLGDHIKNRLVDLIAPGGLPEEERRSRLHAVRLELETVRREHDGIIVA